MSDSGAGETIYRNGFAVTAHSRSRPALKAQPRTTP
jgi:hypothetical protein